MGSQVLSALKVEAMNGYKVLVNFCHAECHPRRWWVLFIIVAAMGMYNLSCLSSAFHNFIKYPFDQC